MAHDGDTRSVPELLADAVDWTKNDGDGDWTAVAMLHLNGSEEVLHAALGLAKSNDHRQRSQAANILGQLGVPERTFLEECLQAILYALNTDPHPHVIQAAAVALGHLKDVRGSAPLAGLISHTDREVRRAVAFALGGRSDAVAVDALIKLTVDSDALVRDWATFGLGETGGLDTPEIREALYCRINDDDETVRYEAICGLVRCGDARAISPLIKAIADDPEDTALWVPAMALLKINDESDEITAADLVEMLSTRLAIWRSERQWQ
jgi:HEAT repeat protein